MCFQQPVECSGVQNATLTRTIPPPPHRLSALKKAWSDVYVPLVDIMKLQVRMNTKCKAVQIRSSVHKTPGALQNGEEFVRAFALGFHIQDAVALLRLDDLYIQTFEIRDVKALQGDHLARAIGRIAGTNGSTRHVMENLTKARIVLSGQNIHILGGFANIHVARETVVSLILEAPTGKVQRGLQSARAKTSSMS
ncbi:hypothetical protein BU23DRAFT_634496 [Bimuria novae-zelandiae CBS 107.79]|uniref:Pre-rRNA-processing protein PNO1 n=1 Tax=Bimuria novae-zelandiae CBS 107.79 TaxID=1447943 RepID=A0A6A5VDS1_9PLEO|nr:hypothetical protein BU23DRAFT_634496 [Bimuria novae-zelandiae CBS 107.79]